MSEYQSIPLSVNHNVTYQYPFIQIDEDSCGYVVSYHRKKYLNTNISNSTSDIEGNQ